MDDWSFIKLGELFDVKAGGDLQNSSFSATYTEHHPSPIFSNSLVDKGLYGYTSVPRYPENSITITGRGSLGHAEFRNEPFDAIVRLLVLIPKVDVDCRYVVFYINSLVNFAVESTGVPQLPAPKIKKTNIYMPKSVDEQRAIANLLSKVDETIECIEDCILKAKFIKKSIMNNLLSGKVKHDGTQRTEEELRNGRLDHAPMKALQTYFSYKLPYQWEILPLKKIIDLKYGIALSESKRSHTGHPVYGSNGVVGYHEIYHCQKPGIIIGRKGTAGAITWSDTPFTPIDTTYYVEPINSKVELNFIYYALQLLNLDKLNAATGVPGLNRRDALSLYVLVPPKKEQKLISEKIINIEETIKNKIDKVQVLKNLRISLMQNLLTGKMRVDIDKINKILREEANG